MKKIITLIVLLTNLIGNAQCPAPSNINVVDNIALLSTAELSWTENGTAVEWEVLVIPYFDIGTPIPTAGWISATTNPFIIVGVPPSACNGFFVRSVCSNTDVSPWAAVVSIACSPNVYNYLASLSNDSFSLNSGLQIFPNASKNVIKIKSTSKIDTITVFDSLGKIIFIQTQNNNEIDVENLSKGIYLIEVVTENEKIYRKFVKE